MDRQAKKKLKRKLKMQKLEKDIQTLKKVKNNDGDAQRRASISKEDDDDDDNDDDAINNEQEADLQDDSQDDESGDADIVNEENLDAYLGAEGGSADAEQRPPNDRNFFTGEKFDSLEICEPTKLALRDMKMKWMTHIQQRTIQHLLKGRDVLGAAKTGSGKTLAFLVPVLEILYRAKFAQKNGTGAIIITPTRELATTIFDVAKELCAYHHKTLGLIIGGADRKQEAYKLKMGINIIVATPGRLLDHLENTKGFVFHNLLALVIDEADAILKIGFEEEMNKILSILPKERQTMLFSATQTKKVDDLARLSLKQPIYIGVDDVAEYATVQGLEQGFVCIEGDKKFLLLFTFLQKNRNKKMMVFFSSCNSVKFHADLLNYVDVPVLSIHGKQKQQKRLNTFYEFTNAEKGTLLCTDVAARGLDIPAVDWIVQYDPPDDTREYIHRVGRTCRGANSRGKALMFLLPEEKGYLAHLQEARVPLNEYEFATNKLANVQDQFDKLIERNYYLHRAAFDAYRSYLHAYNSHSLKAVFDVHNLDLQKLSRSFGFKVPPRVNLNIKISGRTARKNRLKDTHGAMAVKKLQYSDKDKNLLRKNRTNGDNRQFSR